MKYEEFKKYKPYPQENSLVKAYQDEHGHVFYVEPGFYYALEGFKERKKEEYPRILERIYSEIAKYPLLVFTSNYESPFFEKEGCIYREITDITDPLNIFVEDKSRGSDYGD